MIHLFNRAELIITRDLETVNQIRDTLEAGGLGYRVVIQNSLAATTVRNGRAGNIPGHSPCSETMYTIYVRRTDLPYAEHLIKR